MPSILYVTHLAPRPLRSGGESRAYQILVDLQTLVGETNVHVFDPNVPKGGGERRGFRLPWKVERALRRGRVIAKENPYRVFYETHFTMYKFDHAGLLDKYRAAFDAAKPDIVVVSHAACLWTLPFQRERGIKTVVVPHNFDSLDHDFDLTQKRMLNVSMGDLTTEIHALGQYDARLCISKIEAAFVTGIGYPSGFYPYAPVGAIRTFYEGVRAKRAANQQESGLFVLLGTAAHKPIREGMRWLLDQIEQVGLPDGAQVVVAGNGTETLLAGRNIRGVECLGWVDEATLDDLLTRASAMLLPKTRGFGAATRIAEMALAGLPMIASEYVAHALNPLPNLIPVAHNGQAWHDAMERITRGDVPPPAPIEESPSALIDLAKSWLERG